MDPNAAAQRSARVAAVFDRVADTYDAVGVPWFTPIAERLVAEMAPAPGERALDIGTGEVLLCGPWRMPWARPGT